MKISLEKTISLFLAFAVIILAVIIILNTQNPIKKGFLSLFGIEEEKEEIVELDKDIPFFSEFVKNYQECKLSPSTDCFCQLTNPVIPNKYILEIENDQSSKTTTIRAYSNAELSDSCNSISPLAGTAELKTVQETITNDLIFFEDTILFSPDVVGYQTTEPAGGRSGGGLAYVTYPADVDQQFGRFKESDFKQVNKIYLAGKKLCTPEDDIDFSQGFLYKFSQEKTAFSEGVFSLQMCSTIPESLVAYNEFNNFVDRVNKCESNPCTFPVNIPQDFEILVEDKKIVLKYKGTELRSSEEIKKELCVFTHFSMIQRQELPLPTLKLNDYVQVDIYSLDDKLCFLPYDQNLAREKQIALSRA